MWRTTIAAWSSCTHKLLYITSLSFRAWLCSKSSRKPKNLRRSERPTQLLTPLSKFQPFPQCCLFKQIFILRVLFLAWVSLPRETTKSERWKWQQRQKVMLRAAMRATSPRTFLVKGRETRRRPNWEDRDGDANVYLSVSRRQSFQAVWLEGRLLVYKRRNMSAFVMKNLRQAVYHSGKRFSRRKWKPLLSREPISEVKIDRRSSYRNCWLLSDRT